MALHLYLVRHGRTEWNIAGLLQGSGDSPLVEEGILGAKKAGEALANIPFVACYSSMLKRAIDTANYIIGERNIPHFHHRGLNELDFGCWEGKRSADLREHPEYILLKTQPEKYQALENGGETIEQLYQRLNQAIEQILAIHQEGNVLIVSHGMTLTLLTAILKGMAWKDFRNEQWHSFVLNTAISIAKVEDGKIGLIAFNNIGHLSSI